MTRPRPTGSRWRSWARDRLWLALKPIWPDDRAHLPFAEIADWFAAYVYLPKLRDRVVLETAIRDAVAKLDPQFGYADRFDEATGKYRHLIWANTPPMITPAAALLVREAEAKKQLPRKLRSGRQTRAAPRLLDRPRRPDAGPTPGPDLPASPVGSTARSKSTWSVP